MKDLESALSTSFVISLLGFFESSVAAQSLGAGPPDGLQGIALSANRELVALGVANIVGGVFGSLPAFGGYGRSKVNASTGGRTPMSSIFLSLITVVCVLFVLPWFYYIPVCESPVQNTKQLVIILLPGNVIITFAKKLLHEQDAHRSAQHHLHSPQRNVISSSHRSFTRRMSRATWSSVLS